MFLKHVKTEQFVRLISKMQDVFVANNTENSVALTSMF